MTQKQLMAAGLIYNPGDSEIMAEQASCLEMLYEFNSTRPSESEKRQTLMKKMFAKIGEGCYIEPPFRANWAGKHVYVGNNMYANFNLTLVDDGNIFIGDNVMFGPNVTVATANHPIYPELRRKGLQYNKDVHIGSNVWIGASCVIVPGVSIGDNSVIGASSVVTKDIPEGAVAVGNPCRVIRFISERDKEYFYKDEKIDWDNIV